MSKTPSDTSLQEQMKRLDELAAWFEQDDFDIEKAIEKFEEASTLAQAIKIRLAELENTVTVLKERFDGTA